MKMTRQGNRRGFSALELVFGVILLVLIGGFVLLFVGRGRERSAQALLEAPEASRVATSRQPAAYDPSPDSGAMAADWASDGPDVADRSESDGDGRGSEYATSPAAAAAPAAVGAQPTPVAGGEIRAYFSGALAVAGRPDWQKFISLARKLDPRQLPEAWGLLQEQPWSQGKQEAMERFMAQWATQDPHGAIDFAATLPSAHQRRAAYGTAVETWAKADPQGALAWYREHREDDGAGRVPVSRLFAGLYAADPELTLEMVWNIEDGRQQSDIFRTLFFPPGGDYEKGAAQLKTMFGATEDPARRAILAGMVAGAWAENDPMRAIAWGDDLGADPDAQRRVYLAAARAWGRREPEAAMAWMQERGLAQADPSVLREIALSWGHDDPASLRQWIDSTAPSPMRDTVVTARVEHLTHRNPSAALALAESITESEERYKIMASVANHWMRVDRTGAATAVLASSMPAEMKRQYAMRVIPRKNR